MPRKRWQVSDGCPGERPNECDGLKGHRTGLFGAHRPSYSRMGFKLLGEPLASPMAACTESTDVPRT